MRAGVSISQWPRRRGWIALGLWLLLGSWLGGAAPSLAQQPAIDPGLPYADFTRGAIHNLNTAAQYLRSDDYRMAQEVLRLVAMPLEKLGSMTDRVRELADREHDHCIEQITALEVKIGELYLQEQELGRQVQELEAELASATQSRDLAQAEIEQLQEQMAATSAGLREQERKLQELIDWWWVPYYGQYLAIRTLADDDVATYKRLAGRLQDSASQARASAEAIQAAATAVEELTAAQQQAVGTIERLQTMRATEQEQLGELKESAVFLADAGTFWGKVRNLLGFDISDAASHLELLLMELESDVSAPDFEDPSREYMLDLQEAMLRFAATVESGSNFLLEDGIAYCGGPPGV